MTNEEIQKAIASMIALCERREAMFGAEIDQLRQTGPCPTCGVECSLDRDETMAESVRMNRLSPVYSQCSACATESATRELLRGYGVPQRVLHATFANYETLDLNQSAAVRDVQEWMHNPDLVFLFLLGGTGTGKGHLASAAIRGMGCSALWLTHADLMNRYYALDFRGRDNYMRSMAMNSVMVIDEMGGKRMTADTSEVMYDLLDKRYDKGRKTILVGNIPYRSGPKGGPSILGLVGSDRAESRLARTSKIVPCNWADYRRR